MVATLSRTLVSVTLSSSAEHITAYAHRMGGEYVGSQIKGDRDYPNFRFLTIISTPLTSKQALVVSEVL
jgi:hypothetical protein